MRPLLAGIFIICLVLARDGAAAAPNLQQPPEPIPKDFPVLPSLLRNPVRQPIVSTAQWKKERLRIKNQWRDLLGDLPKHKVPLLAKTISTEVLDDCTRSLLKYQIEPGIETDGYLLVPNHRPKKAPAVVVFHPTTPLGPKGVAGVDLLYAADKRQGLQLVKRGFIVWCPRNYINMPGADWAGNARRVKAAHPKWTGMTRIIWDAIRAADFVESLPEVDRNRIGCMGHSLGAKVVLYAMAFDERYKAGVFSEGGIGLRFSNWDAPWYLGSKIRSKGFALENDQILALIAPRAFLLLAGDKADSARSWAFIQAVLPVYKLLGAPRNIGWYDHHGGHAYPPEARAIAEDFLHEHLPE